MVPEYAMFGQFSVKLDIFSFGVLILEIVRGQKITRFHDEENIEYLLTYVSMNINRYYILCERRVGWILRIRKNKNRYRF